jgi:Cu+-exporting ATPase
VAQAIAGQVGIDEVHAELLPGQKVEAIERFQAQGRTVAMVGDGINDAPALVQSDVGIALGAGTDVAMESAGVVLVSDQMEKVVSALVLGRASHRKMKQNIAIAVAANVIGMTMAILGLVTAPVAIAIMTASIFAVLLWTLSLLRLRLDVPEAAAEEENVVETLIPARRMHCDNCARNINRNLAKAKGVQRVTADATRKEVLVAYRPAETSEEALRHQLEEMGFR